MADFAIERAARARVATWLRLSGLALAGTAALAGCGSGGTKTVSVGNTTAAETTTQPTTKTGTSKSSSPSTTSTNTTTPAGETGGSEASRTATAPAFTKEAHSAEGADAAAALVRSHGYTPTDTSQYHPDQTLRVLVATKTGSADGYGQQAFFFVDGHYLGTDTSQPSATVKLVSQGDTEVALSYPIYKPGDPLGKPSGGEKTVRFQLNNGHLVPLGQIPSTAERSGE